MTTRSTRSNRGRASIPQMPDFDVTELDETPLTMDADEQSDKLEEKKMAEIIVKLQIAKQKAAEAKKVSYRLLVIRS